MKNRYILAEEFQSVVRLTLNRSEKLNSFNSEMASEFIDVLTEYKENKNIRCIIITGKGRAFCAGQDLAEVIEQGLELGEIVSKCYNPIIKLIREMPKPIIASVNGVAAGAGANLALACDIVVASREAFFIQAFSKIGLIPDSGGTFMLPRLIGMARATALTYFGEKLMADDAVDIGLIYKRFEEEHLQKETMKLAIKLSQMPTLGLAFTKEALNKSFENSLTQQLSLEEELQNKAGKTYDYSEGVAAFIEKRKPQFKGE